MTEIEKAEETIKWFKLFDLMREQALTDSINLTSFNANLKITISKGIRACEDIINPPEPKVLLKSKTKKS